MEIRCANVLLLADESDDRKRKKDVVIAEMLHITPQAVHNIKQHFLDRVSTSDTQPETGIRRKRRDTPPVPAKCTGDVEAKIIAIACSIPPEGFGRWTLRMISERAVELEIIDSISHTQVGRILKNEFKPHLKKMWCIPPEQNAAFVAAMEDVLEVYSRPYNPKMPVVCMDEQPIELHSDSRDKIALSKENHTEKVDHEYVRHGTCCGFMFTEPLDGWRRMDIKERRCKVDWAEQIKQLVDVDFPDAHKIVLVCDNLNTHNISSLYEAFEPSEARRIWERLELHHAPKHGS